MSALDPGTRSGGGGTRFRLSSMADRKTGKHIFILYL